MDENVHLHTLPNQELRGIKYALWRATVDVHSLYVKVRQTSYSLRRPTLILQDSTHRAISLQTTYDIWPTFDFQGDCSPSQYKKHLTFGLPLEKYL